MVRGLAAALVSGALAVVAAAGAFVAQRIEGRHAGGAAWAIDRTADWNGTLRQLWMRGAGEPAPGDEAGDAR